MQPETIVKILTDVTGLFGSTKQLHDLLVAHPQEAARVIPVIQNLGEAPSALEAAEKAAPNLTAAIKALVGLPDHVPEKVSPIPNMAKAENVLRSIAGVGHMTPDQERLWMDHTAGSTFGGQPWGG